MNWSSWNSADTVRVLHVSNWITNYVVWHNLEFIALITCSLRKTSLRYVFQYRSIFIQNILHWRVRGLLLRKSIRKTEIFSERFRLHFKSHDMSSSWTQYSCQTYFILLQKRVSLTSLRPIRRREPKHTRCLRTTEEAESILRSSWRSPFGSDTSDLIIDFVEHRSEILKMSTWRAGSHQLQLLMSFFFCVSERDTSEQIKSEERCSRFQSSETIIFLLHYGYILLTLLTCQTRWTRGKTT